MTARYVVVDTNVVVAGLVTSDPQAPTAIVLDGMREGRFPFLLSVALLAEYRTVLRRPRNRKLHGLTDSQMDEVLEALAPCGAVREPALGPSALDRGDDHLWALLRAAPGSSARC